MANLSTNCPEDVAVRTRMVAMKEGRSVSNLVENAVAIFTAMPKGVRDKLREEYKTNAKGFDTTMLDLERFFMNLRFANAESALVNSGPSYDNLTEADEVTINETATRMLRG